MIQEFLEEFSENPSIVGFLEYKPFTREFGNVGSQYRMGRKFLREKEQVKTLNFN